MAKPTEKINICQTFISDTNDLFVMIQSKKMYKLYMIDLDASNLKELGSSASMEKVRADPSSLYFAGGRKPILEYADKDVNEK